MDRSGKKRTPQCRCSTARVRDATKLLNRWFWEMYHDAEDGSYECTCEPDDPCTFHAVGEFVGATQTMMRKALEPLNGR